MNIDKNINTILKTIEEKYGKSSDIVSRKIKVSRKEIMYIYLESVSSDDKISDFLMKDLSSYIKNNKISLFDNLFESLQNTIFNSHLKTIDNYEDIYYYLASGYTVIFINGEKKSDSY